MFLLCVQTAKSHVSRSKGSISASEDAVLFYSGFDCKYADLGSIDYNYECRKSCLLVVINLEQKRK